MIKLILSLAAGSILFFTSCKSQSPELERYIMNGATLIDVRTEKEFSEGSVEGAMNIPLDQVESSLDKFKNMKSIVVFCRSGNRSGKALKILNDNGVVNVINGGGWSTVNKIKESIEN